MISDLFSNKRLRLKDRRYLNNEQKPTLLRK